MLSGSVKKLLLILLGGVLLLTIAVYVMHAHTSESLSTSTSELAYQTAIACRDSKARIDVEGEKCQPLGSFAVNIKRFEAQFRENFAKEKGINADEVRTEFDYLKDDHQFVRAVKVRVQVDDNTFLGTCAFEEKEEEIHA